MKAKELLIECAKEMGYVEVGGGILPPEHYGEATSRNIIIFMKEGGEATLNTLRMFSIKEDSLIKYLGGDGDGVTDLNLYSPESLEKFKKILEYGDGRGS